MNTLFKPDFRQTLEAFEVPGASIAVVKDNAVVFAAGYGVRELGYNQPVDEHSLFAAGSISKSFTATCLAMLVGEGKLAWDDPVTKYLPGFQLHDAYATREMTIRDLLTHRSGLAEVSGGTVWYGSTYDRREIIQRIRHLKPVSSFRSQFAYQNVMYLVAGEIIPAVTGVSWDDFVQERLLKPLNMTSSNTSTDSLSNASNVAMPHARLEEKVKRVAYRNYDNVGPAASINSSAVDLAQFIRLHLNGGRFGDQTLVDSKAITELTRAQITIPIEPRPAELSALTPKFYSYGLGWFLRDYRGRKVNLHTGSVDGMTALAALVPEEQPSSCPRNQEEPSVVCYHVLDTFFGEPQTDWFAAYLAWRQKYREQNRASKDETVKSRVSGTAPALPIKDYAGSFHDTLYGDATVALEDERLVLRFGRSPCFTGDLEHWHYDTFRIHWRDPMIPKGLVTFPLTSHAKIGEMRFDQPRLLDVDFAELDFKRVVETEASEPQ
jgi:CubicO group peptidase (beta-lactamase class C family)